MNRDVFRETAPVCEAGLQLMIANLLIAAAARRACATCTHERHFDPIAHVPSSYEFAFGCTDARQLVARNMRYANVRVVSHPTVPIASAQSGRLDADDYAIVGWNRFADLLHAQRRTK